MTTSTIGTIIGDRYRVSGKIGAGGMGTVWSGQDIVLRRPVAIKEVVIPQGLNDTDTQRLRARYLREGRAAARLQHRNVVKVYDVVEDQGSPDPHASDGGRVWIVMELLSAKDLAQTIRASGPLQPLAAAEVGLQILDALDAAHDVGVLHRDVKPANVLLCEPDEREQRSQWRAVLSDFGIASIVGDPQITRTGQLLGSPAYLPPERLSSSHEVGPASDLWSLGCTLFAAVEGRAPFHHEDPFKVITAITLDPVPAPRRAGPLAPVINGLLEKDPGLRWTSQETRLALRQVLAGDAVTMPYLSTQQRGRGQHGSPLRDSASARVREHHTLAGDDEYDRSPSAGAAHERQRRSTAPVVAGVCALVLILVAALGFVSHKYLGWPAWSDNSQHAGKAGYDSQYQAFTNADFGYHLEYPQSWQYSCPQTSNACTFGSNIDDLDNHVALSVEAHGENHASPSSISRQEDEKNSRALHGYRLKEYNPNAVIGEQSGSLLDYTFRSSKRLRRVVVFYLTGDDQRLYKISLNGPREKMDSQVGVFRQIVKSLSWTGDDERATRSSTPHTPEQPPSPTDKPSSEPTPTPSSPPSKESSSPSTKPTKPTPSASSSAPPSDVDPSTHPSTKIPER